MSNLNRIKEIAGMDISEKLRQSVIHHWDLLCLMFVMAIGGAWWGNQTFATETDIDGAINPLIEQIEELKTSVAANGDAIKAFQLSALQQERRDLTRQINALERILADGDATERDRETLSDLISDLDDVNDAITRRQED